LGGGVQISSILHGHYWSCSHSESPTLPLTLVHPLKISSQGKPSHSDMTLLSVLYHMCPDVIFTYSFVCVCVPFMHLVHCLLWFVFVKLCGFS
jgi:hypothetical protein